ncbi:copine-3-like [Babylonia areolata]|uniref:copine-3-like n=1 Tax=Babylonia areolata TaxID=304850 RepID=UPI003FD33A10
MAGMRGPGLQCVSKVELRIECRSLRNRDTMSKSDPCAVLFLHNGHKWMEEGRTESIKNELDPRFVRAFSLDYYFEMVQKVKVAVYDMDNSTDSLKDDDFLGQIECTLGQLVSGSPFTRHLLKKDGKKEGESSITIRTEEIKEGSELVEMLFRAKKLENKDFMGKSDPFLQLSSLTRDGNQQVIWKTEVVKNNLNPEWQMFSIRLNTLCGGDRSQPIRFDVFDWDGDGSHDLIGGFNATLDEMLKAGDGGVSWPCINQKKKDKKKSYTDSGTVTLAKCQITKEFSFLDFVFGGLQISLTIAIDFTGSNGNPRNPDSLHYVDPMRPNEYMQAITAVGHVVQDYDSDKLFPVLGFGAALPPTNQVSFEFAVNFHPENPFCAGIEGVLQAYQNCIRQVQLYGPTNVAPIIHHVARFAKQAQDQEMNGKGAAAYFVLLLLTDGALTDVDETIDAIVRASSLPMSLIIVGVGGADFSLMNVLDGDDGVLRSASGQRVVRDIVQFVPFREFKHTSADQLARHVLAEIPKQVSGYFKMRGLPPNTPRTGPAPPPPQ